jgi:hypothetical protein
MNEEEKREMARSNWEAQMNALGYDASGNALPRASDHSEMRTYRKLGRWKQIHDVVTPGGTPYFECALCGGSGHLHGEEFPKRKMICDNCGNANIYPWEKAYEEGSSLWVADDTYKR